MKMNDKTDHGKHLTYVISIWLCHATLLVPIAANSDPVTREEIQITDTNDKASGTAHKKHDDSFTHIREQYQPQNTRLPDNRSITTKTPEEKPKELTAFFMIGIAINIIMASTFAWWFSKEWRKSKK